MARVTEDTTIAICNSMNLEIKEMRESSTCYSPKEGFEEVSSETRTCFHWRLRGIASKLGADIIASDDFDVKEQEVYDVTIASQGFELGFVDFKSREGAIRNALAFAERNGIKVDGYKVKMSSQ